MRVIALSALVLPLGSDSSRRSRTSIILHRQANTRRYWRTLAGTPGRTAGSGERSRTDQNEVRQVDGKRPNRRVAVSRAAWQNQQRRLHVQVGCIAEPSIGGVHSSVPEIGLEAWGEKDDFGPEVRDGINGPGDAPQTEFAIGLDVNRQSNGRLAISRVSKAARSVRSMTWEPISSARMAAHR